MFCVQKVKTVLIFIVNRGMVKFKKGRVSSTDLLRPGRPSSSRTDANKERVENLILSDRRVTVEDICAHTGLTHGTVMRIIKEDLQMTKVSARWVPKMPRQRSTTQGSNCHRIPGGTGNWDTSTSSLFTWPCSERFLVVWHPETLSPRKTISFKIKSRFSSLPVSKTHT